MHSTAFSLSGIGVINRMEHVGRNKIVTASQAKGEPMKLINADIVLEYINRLEHSGFGKHKALKFLAKYITALPDEAEEIRKEQWERERDRLD